MTLQTIKNKIFHGIKSCLDGCTKSIFSNETQEKAHLFVANILPLLTIPILATRDGGFYSGTTSVAVAGMASYYLTKKDLSVMETIQGGYHFLKHLIFKRKRPSLNDVHSLPSMRLMIAFGADPEVKGYTGQTPIHKASSCGHTKNVQELIKAGIDVNAKDPFDRTPLHKAASNGNLEVTRALIKLRADLNAKDRWNQTPLHLAAKKGHTQIIDTLIQAGANIHEKDNNQETPLHIACSKGKLETILHLLQNGADWSTRNKDDESPISLLTKNLSDRDIAKIEEQIEKCIFAGYRALYRTDDEVDAMSYVFQGNMNKRNRESVMEYLLGKDLALVNKKIRIKKRLKNG